MKILLTGANGFVGSRILARLASAKVPAVVLLRSASSRKLIQPWIDQVEVCLGALEDPESLGRALVGVTHVIHCAGKTKALDVAEFERVNVRGTRCLVEAVNACQRQVRRVIHISSLAASHPALADAPAREDDVSAPVSAYGRSKLAGEGEVRDLATAEPVILRPAGVYGPGDADFFQLFQAVQTGWCPQFGGGRQPLSLVHADDLAEVVFGCLDAEGVVGRVYHVAHPQVVTAEELTRAVAAVMDRRPRLIPLPTVFLVPLSWGGELVSRWSGRPGILGVDRRRELMAPGWVCDTSRLREDAGLACRIGLEEGLRQTLAWYRREGWL